MRRSLSILAIAVAALMAAPTCAAAAPRQAPAPSIYPGGLVVRLRSVERLPSTQAAHCDAQGTCTPGGAPDEVLIRVTIGLSLPARAAQPIDLDVVAGSAAGIALLAGADRHATAIDCGYLGEAETLCTDNGGQVPTRVAPGVEVRLAESFDVPSDDLGALTVTVQPPISDATGVNPMRVTTFLNAEQHLGR